MPIIDGTQALPHQGAADRSLAADDLPAGEPSAFVRDRRRPGRVNTGNPQLIALMRGGSADAGAAMPETRRRNVLLWIIAACAVFWAVASALIAAFA